MEFRVYLHLKSFHVDRWGFDFLFKIISSTIDQVSNIVESKTHYKKESAISKLTLYSDIEINNLTFDNKNIYTYIYERFHDFSMFDRYFGKIKFTDCERHIYPRYIENNSRADVTKTIFSEMYDHVSSSENNISFSLCRPHCSLKIGNLEVSQGEQAFTIPHLNLLDLDTETEIHNILESLIFNPDSNNYMTSRQTFLRDSNTYTKVARTAIYTDGNYFYKIDRSHRGRSAHVEQSFDQSFDDRRRLDAYKNPRKQRD